MLFNLFEVVLLLCLFSSSWFLFRKVLFTKAAVKKALCDSLETLPIGAYVSYVRKGRKTNLFSNSVVQEIYNCKGSIFEAPTWNQDEDDEIDKKLINGQKSYCSTEKTIQTWGGATKYVVVEKKKILVSKRDFFIVTTFLDITEQKRTQFLLEENQRDINFAMNVGKTIIWKYDVAEDRFAALLGDARLKNGIEFDDALYMIHPEDRVAFNELLNDLKAGNREEGEIVLRARMDDSEEYAYYNSWLSRRYNPLEKKVYVIGSQRDITKKRVKEMEMQNIRNSLNLAINAANILAWDYDLETCKYRKLYGQHEVEAVKSVRDGVWNTHPDDREEYIAMVNNLVAGNYPEDKATMLVRMRDEHDDPSQEYRHYKCMIQATRNVTGRMERLIGICVDITKQVENEAIIRHNADFLNTVLDNIPFPTHVKDITDGFKYQFWNKASKLLFGDCTGGTASQLLISEQARRIDDLDKIIYDSEKSYQEQERLYLRDGRVLDTIVYKNIIHDGTKKLILTVRWDIGELIRMQRHLEDVRRRDEIIINNTNSGLAYITSDYVVQWENISICTPDISYEAYKRGELCYKSAYGRETPCEDCLLKRVIATKKIAQKEFQLLNKRHVEVLANPVLKSDGELEGIVIRLDDVTDRRKMIEELKSAKEKAEESDKLKSAFLANISHEIRTPLNAIVGFSSLLLQADDDGEREQFMKIIANNNELLLRLINDILELSVIESGVINVKKQEVYLTDLFSEIEASFIFKLHAGVQLISDVPNEKLIVKTDAERLKQVLIQLLINAIKFTTQGYIKIGYKMIDHGICSYVEDTGVGITEEFRNRIFERFEKEDTFSQGTGLGLSICKAIADACGWRIGVESALGKGSTFWVWMPTA